MPICQSGGLSLHPSGVEEIHGKKVLWDNTRSDSGASAQGPPLEGEISTGRQHCGSRIWGHFGEALVVYGPFSDVTVVSFQKG